jgi:hypothetical protein
MTSVANDVSLGRQVLRRDVNVRIRSVGDASGTIGVFCECGRRRCADQIQLAAQAYSDVLGSSGRYVVSPGHEDLDAERLIDRHDGYVVVERDR